MNIRDLYSFFLTATRFFSRLATPLFPALPLAEAYCFEVVDTGIGVPEADQERVMEPFVQVHGGKHSSFRK